MKNCSWSRGWFHNWLFTRLSVFWVILQVIATYLSKQQKLDVDPKAIQQISFNGSLEEYNATMLLIIEETKETVLIFQKELWDYCEFVLL